MTNLLLSYPSIPFDAVARAQSVTFDSLRPIGNTISGERYQYASATAGGSGAIDMEWDLGLGVTRAVDHIIVSNAYKLRQQGSTSIALDTASDGIDGSYSNVWTDANFGTATLYGPESLDYFTSGLSLSAARTWKAKLSGGSATTREINKIYFGTAWDCGKEPDEFSLTLQKAEGGQVKLEDGADKMIRLGDAKYRFSVVWDAVSDANANTFTNKIKRYWQQHKFFLYTTDNHRILNNMRLLHVRFASEPTVSRGSYLVGNSRYGRNTISCEFIEVKG